VAAATEARDALASVRTMEVGVAPGLTTMEAEPKVAEIAASSVVKLRPVTVIVRFPPPRLTDAEGLPWEIATFWMVGYAAAARSSSATKASSISAKRASYLRCSRVMTESTSREKWVAVRMESDRGLYMGKAP
jgi:hypothetical protein